MRGMFRVFLALLAFAGPAGAQDFKASGQPGAFNSLTINQQTAAGTAELTLTNAARTHSHVFSHVTNNELKIQNNGVGINTLILENLSTSGFSALVARAADVSFPSTNQDASGSYEHFAIGYGAGLSSNGRTGFNYIESSRFNGASSALLPPSEFRIQQTGGAFLAPTFDVWVTTAGLATVTKWGGGSFPAGINGRQVREQGNGGFYTEGTTIVSGEGTATLTLSNPALASNGFVPTIYGVQTYGQYNAIVFRDRTSIDFYTWANGASSTAPYMRLDRNNGRVGIGTYGNNLYPQASLDVIGNGIFGTDTSARTAAWASYPINISTTGAQMQKWLKVGVNTAVWQWTASPNGVQLYDANANASVFTAYMDGTSRVLVSANSGATASTSAQFQVDATTRGFLPPRMTTAQKNAISSPATGLVVYDTDLGKLCVYTGAAWQTITSASIGEIRIYAANDNVGQKSTARAA